MPLEKLSESFRGKKDHVSEGISASEDPGITDVMPVVPHKVLYAALPFYSDSECTRQVEGATITVLQPLDPDGFQLLDVVPTCKRYDVGDYVSWQLNKDKVWEESYYLNPESGQVEQAWTMHVEFVGRRISEKALAQDRERLEKLETEYSEGDQQVM